MTFSPRTSFFPATLALSLLVALSPGLAPRAAEAQIRGRTEADAPDLVAIRDARIVTVSGRTFDSGTLVVDRGVITALGSGVDIPAGAWVIDGEGLTVYPGLIDGLSSLGMGSGSSARRARPGAGGGDPGTTPGRSATPYSTGPDDRPATLTWVNAADELEPDQDAFAGWRAAGFTAAVTAPGNGFFPGHAALVNLGDGQGRELVVKTPVALRMNLRGGPGHRGFPGSLMGSFAYIAQLFMDARHYREAWSTYEADPRGSARPPYDRALEHLTPILEGRERLLFPANSMTEIRRALKVSGDLGVRAVLYGVQHAYQAPEVLASSGVPVLVSLDWPAEDVDADPEAEPTLETLRLRLLAPTTPAALERAGVPFAFYTDGVVQGEVLAAARKAVEAGLSHDAAVRALTLSPAEIFGVADRVGSLEEGKIANLVVTDGDLFAEDTEVKMVFVDGAHYEAEVGSGRPGRMAGRGRPGGRSGRPAAGGDTEEDEEDEEDEVSEAELRERIGPSYRVPYRDDRVTLIRNATILTVTEGTIQGGSVLIRDGKIAAVGPDVPAPSGAHVIDAQGMFVTPGIIDAHSHIAGGGNEGTVSVSAMVGIEDVINPDDINIYRALAGGVTTVNVLHGSANPIGGKNAVLKLRWGQDAEGLKLQGAPPGIKFALGENPTRDRNPDRYPATRMGVMDVIRQAFLDARQYMDGWQAYQRMQARGETAMPPRRNLKLESLAEILRGERLVHAHSYRADEILQLLRLAEEFGFRIATFQHVLEGYKVADELAAHGAGASTFSDWWAYKVEAYDAIPYNAAIMTERGVLVSINSDSGEEMRHLNEEAAKTIRWGGLSEEQALSLITINPARQLGIHDRVGSIEVGKDADLAVFDRHPLDNYSMVRMTFVDGKLYFDREGDLKRRRRVQEEREALMNKEEDRPVTDAQPQAAGGVR